MWGEGRGGPSDRGKSKIKDTAGREIDKTVGDRREREKMMERKGTEEQL